jgi:hypothetical protein
MSNSFVSTATVLERPAFDAITAWGMVLLAVLMATVWASLLARRQKRYGVGAAAFFVAVLLVNLMGDRLGWFVRLDTLPPPFVVMNLTILSIVLVIGMGYANQLGNMLVKSIQIETLVALQIFRLPLELLMLRAAYLQIMPMEFSMMGYNLDVLTGLGALLISIYCAWTWSLPLKVIWVWNLLGIACLLVIAVLAVLTSPNVRAFGATPRHINSWVLYFPYSLLPSVLVSLAVLGHVLLTRKLLAEHRVQLPRLSWPLWLKSSPDAW